MHAVFVPVAAEQQAVLLAQRKVVLPGDLVPVGVEHKAFGAELVALVVTVFAVGQFQPRMPGFGKLGIEVTAQAADAEIGVGLLPEAFKGDRVETAERVVVLATAAAIEQVQAGLETLVKSVAQAQVQRLVAVGIVVTIAGERRPGRVDAGSFIQAGAQVEAGRIVAARKPQAALECLVAASGQAQARLQAGAITTAGKDLDHPANGIAAIHRRARAAQHFDTFDLIHIEKLQAAVAGGGVGDAHTIDQHQALGGLGAADEDARQAAASTGRGHLYAGRAGEQVGDAGGLQAVDVGAGEDGVGGAGGCA